MCKFWIIRAIKRGVGGVLGGGESKQKIEIARHWKNAKLKNGSSSRLYILQGPKELMPPESDLKSVKYAKMRAEMEDWEASLMRARREASLADGISWGMGEDAIEEAEIAHMKKEIGAIRAKDISQGGLTQGQQTQIARNEQRISQLLEELENLEETLKVSKKV
ncbi:hypothetical protein RJ641_023020 [Dillenia turbinata]|uniref:Uncharacterized protein n=1 Tax=Dillenia turbinata TaxID=194707 RepID=A0AAN8UG74_9MAGN